MVGPSSIIRLGKRRASSRSEPPEMALHRDYTLLWRERRRDRGISRRSARSYPTAPRTPCRVNAGMLAFQVTSAAVGCCDFRQKKLSGSYLAFKVANFSYFAWP